MARCIPLTIRYRFSPSTPRKHALVTRRRTMRNLLDRSSDREFQSPHGRARRVGRAKKKQLVTFFFDQRVAFFSSAGVGKFFVILLRLKKKAFFDFQKRDTQWKKHYTSHNEFSSNWGQKSIVCSIFKHMLWKGEIENQSKVACCVVFLRGI